MQLVILYIRMNMKNFQYIGIDDDSNSIQVFGRISEHENIRDSNFGFRSRFKMIRVLLFIYLFFHSFANPFPPL